MNDNSRGRFVANQRDRRGHASENVDPCELPEQCPARGNRTGLEGLSQKEIEIIGAVAKPDETKSQ
jgi:hypothetical protein